MNADQQSKIILVIDAELDWLTSQSVNLASRSRQLQPPQTNSHQLDSLQILTADCLAAAAKICAEKAIVTVVADSLQLNLEIEPMFLADLPLIIVSAGQRSAVVFKRGLNRSCFSLRKSSCVELLPCFVELADSICERRGSRSPIKPPKMLFPTIENGAITAPSSIHTLY